MFHRMWGIFRLAEVLLASQEGFCFLALVHLAVLVIHMCKFS